MKRKDMTIKTIRKAAEVLRDSGFKVTAHAVGAMHGVRTEPHAKVRRVIRKEFQCNWGEWSRLNGFKEVSA